MEKILYKCIYRGIIDNGDYETVSKIEKLSDKHEIVSYLEFKAIRRKSTKSLA